MEFNGHKFPDWLAHLWAWLPWLAAGVATIVSFANNLLTIVKSLRKWQRHRRQIKLASRHKSLEVEVQSEA